MKLELIELYPMYGVVGKYLYLSAHVYLIDLGIDLRGVKVKIDPNGVSLFDPTERSIDYANKAKLVSYPIFKFINVDLNALILPLVSEMALKMYRDPYTFDRLEKDYVTYQSVIFRLAEENVKVKHKLAAKKANAPKPKVAKGPKQDKPKRTPTARLTPYTPKPRPPITGFKPKSFNK